MIRIASLTDLPKNTKQILRKLKKQNELKKPYFISKKITIGVERALREEGLLRIAALDLAFPSTRTFNYSNKEKGGKI